MKPLPEHRLRAADNAYRGICPECAAPKHRQSRRCADCYYDARRRGEYPPPPVPQRKPKAERPRGGSKGRPQPQEHPWRRRIARDVFEARRRAA